jgi:hypothetical protein
VHVERRPSSRPRAYRRRRAPWVYWLRRGVLVGTCLLLVATAWSIVGALRAPGDDDASVKLAEWARDHGLGPVVTAAEAVQYKLDPPQSGGTPDTSQLASGAAEGARVTTTAGAHRGSTVVPLQARLSTPVTPALPGEGVFVPASSTKAGPLVQFTYVRPDTVHTSYLTGVAWMSHTLRFVLHPGFQDPGTAGMSQPAWITTSQLPGLLASFNGGFKLKDAEGGYYDHGHTVGTLVPGAASFVVYRDGHATVGTWGSDIRMTPDVAFVRQNLQPLVSGGLVAPNLDANVQSNWGATVGGGYAVWRSGIGVTAAGDLVWAGGDALSVGSLADILHRAGAVSAMQLDINKAWVSFMSYTHAGSGVTPHKLGSFQRPADRYLSPTSRDFVAVYAP